MKNPYVPKSAVSSNSVVESSIPLHKLVDQLMTGLLPLAVDKKSFILNDVDHSFMLQADEDLLAFIVGSMMSNAVSCTDSVCIRVEACINDAGIHIMVRNDGSCFYSTVSNAFSHALQAAQKLGGNISISNQKNEGTTVIFSLGAPHKIAC